MHRMLLAGLAILLLVAAGCQKPSPEAQLRTALDLALKGPEADKQEALTILKKLSKQGTPHVQVSQLRALCLLRLGRYAETIEVCRDALERHADDYVLNFAIGRALYQTSDYDSAVVYLEKARLQRKDDPNVMLLHALAAGKSGDPRAGAWFERLLRRDAFRDHPLLLNEYAVWVASRAGDEAEALGLLARLEPIDRQPPVIYRNMAILYERRGFDLPAQQFYELYLGAAAPSGDLSAIRDKVIYLKALQTTARQ